MSTGGQAILCLEPHIEGPRHSGGYFFNDCLAAAARSSATPQLPQQIPGQPGFSIQSWDEGPLPSAFILLDSLWWYIHRRPLDVLAKALAGRSWGIIMHGLPDQASGLLGDMAEASFVVVPSFWALGQLEAVRSSGRLSGRSSAAIGGGLDVRVLYPGWDGRPGLVPDPGISGDGLPAIQRDSHVHRPLLIASSSNWTRAKGLLEAARVLRTLSRSPDCPPWLWQAAGTPDQALVAEAHSGLGPLASRLEPLGHLDPAALVRLLHCADIFLHPSVQETFCLSVFEAALAGCRIVARAIGGVPEAIHLARLLRSQLGLPPVGVHLAPAGVQPGPVHRETDPGGITDPLYQSLEEALLGAAKNSAAGSGNRNYEERFNPALNTISIDQKNPVGSWDFGINAKAGNTASTIFSNDLLQEFSWKGRLEKLLLGLSDRPLPPAIQPEHPEAL